MENKKISFTSFAICVSVDRREAKTIVMRFLGDLEIYLVAPNNRKVLLQNRTLGRQTHLNKTYTMGSHPALKQLLSLKAKGRWELLIVDLAPKDVGNLNSWELTLGI